MIRKAYVVVVLVVAGLTRFVGLALPEEVVFDEVHFGKFVSAYCCTGERFFDIHPPHAKLLIAGVVAVTAYEGRFPFSYIGQTYEGVPIAAFRFVPALTGLLLAVVVFWLLRELGSSPEAGLVGGLAVALDNALIVQSRVLSLDGVLLLAVAVTLLMVMMMRRNYGHWTVGLAIAAGGSAGVAAGSKFTGLIALGLVGLIMAVDLVQKKEWQRQVGLGVVVLFSFAMVYLGGWMIHFRLLTEPGPGDAWQIPERGFFEQVIAWHKLMLVENYGLAADHPDASAWWNWPLMRRPVFYWQGEERMIYLLGNPVVWWGSTAVLLWLLAVRKLSDWRLGHESILLVGYVASLLPLALVPRVLFLYHYLPALVLAILLGVWWLDGRGMWRKKGMVGLAVGLLVAGWLVVSPVTYGWPMLL